MRQIIIFYIFSFIFIISFAQEKKIRSYHTIDYTPFIGEWVYKSKDTTFTVNLKPTIVAGRFFHAEQLCGRYTLKTKNGTSSWQGECLDTTRVVDKYENTHQLGVFAYAYGDIGALNPNLLRFTIYDKEKMHDQGHGNRGGKIFLLSTDSIKWILNEQEGAKISDIPFENLGFSVPTNIVMTKKKLKRKDRKTINHYRERATQRGEVIKKPSSKVDLDKFVGTWRYENNDTIFRIKLKKEFHNNTFWWLVGTYEFHAKNITSNKSNEDNDINSNRICIYAQNYNSYDESDSKFLYLNFRDQIKKHNHGTGLHRGKMKLISSDKIHWDLRREKHEKTTYEYSVPINVILTKEY